MITLLDGNGKGNGGEEEGLGMKRNDKFVAVDWRKFAIFLIGCEHSGREDQGPRKAYTTTC